MAPLNLLPILLLLPLTLAHGSHEQTPMHDTSDWASRHMAEEHHISTFDASAFFSLHDYSSRGNWDEDDVLKTYGLKDPSSSHVSAQGREHLLKQIFDLYDTNHDKQISRDEFVSAFDAGRRLPDFGYGPGHHGDDEYEYEIHHWEKYHGDDTKEEDLVHPEDIEHFAKHEQREREEEELERREKEGGLVVENIPGKFKRSA
ncbi:putative secretory pathway protein Ssp120 [Myriangium duriaei CBS 260.36]|uniref:Secretory pathway protein Ssp120 n=1 Tax=Myriangium duriaei CBS 260.36 TaxID=1168546 RepID=A0A9P4MGN9_9PEZI|nr:putative secretory pathway protein Ssp120 [Myriangium duriaei CBS 260.36]